VCTQAAVTLTRDDYVIVLPPNKKGQAKRRIHTYQPLPYGTYEWAMVHAPWRSRLEGTIGTLSDHHGRWGGRHGFEVRGRRGRTKVALLAICAAVAFNLTRQGYFLPDHGTGDHPDDEDANPATGSEIGAPANKVKALRGILEHRRQQRANLDPTTCTCVTHTLADGADPPALVHNPSSLRHTLETRRLLAYRFQSSTAGNVGFRSRRRSGHDSHGALRPARDGVRRARRTALHHLRPPWSRRQRDRVPPAGSGRGDRRRAAARPDPPGTR
jgi:hypothetical protein